MTYRISLLAGKNQVPSAICTISGGGLVVHPGNRHLGISKGREMELKDLVNWNEVMKQPRRAGGHTEVMENLFIGAEILASYVENDYQGSEAYVYKLPDGKIALVNDYFGSCSGCDSWEDASDEYAKSLIIELCNNAKVVNNIQEAIDYLKETQTNTGTYYDWSNLSDQILTQLESKNTPK